MTARSLLLAGGLACGLAIIAAAPASARTICRWDGYCFNTSGRPIYPQYGYSYGYGPGWGYWRWRHHHHHYYNDGY